MPKSTTSRPYNRKEKEAAVRDVARSRAVSHLNDMRSKAEDEGDLLTADKFSQMRGKIWMGKPSVEDADTLVKRRLKEGFRKSYKYRDRPTNTVQSKAKGGKVKSADGCATRGKTRAAMKGYGKIG